MKGYDMVWHWGVGGVLMIWWLVYTRMGGLCDVLCVAIVNCVVQYLGHCNS